MSVESLEARIRANLDDTSAWLVYGDWLTEQGDARGQLIQLEHLTKKDEAASLTKKHKSRWRLPKGTTALDQRFGFATRARVLWGDGAPATLAALARSREARFLTTLVIRSKTAPDEEDEESWDEPTPVDFSAFDGCEVAPTVTHLDLGYNFTDAAGVRAFLSSPHLARLVALDLRYVPLGDEGAALLAAASLPELRVLDLQRAEIGPSGAEALADAHFPKLARLDLRYNAVGPRGGRALAAARFAPSLESLLLYRSDLEAEGARALAASKALRPAVRNLWKGT